MSGCNSKHVKLKVPSTEVNYETRPPPTGTEESRSTRPTSASEPPLDSNEPEDTARQTASASHSSDLATENPVKASPAYSSYENRDRALDTPSAHRSSESVSMEAGTSRQWGEVMQLQPKLTSGEEAGCEARSNVCADASPTGMQRGRESNEDHGEDPAASSPLSSDKAEDVASGATSSTDTTDTQDSPDGQGLSDLLDLMMPAE